VDGSQDMESVFAGTCAALTAAMEREVMDATRAQIEVNAHVCLQARA
jgi:hypothetical protein